jgi:hypothetical protein
VKPAQRRQLVDDARSTWQVSIRRIYSTLVTEPSTYYYKNQRAGRAIDHHNSTLSTDDVPAAVADLKRNDDKR